MAKCPNLTQFEYFGGNFEFYSSINKGATIRLPGGGELGFFFRKNIPALALAMCEKNILAPSTDKKISALYPWKENVFPLYMKRKCMPSMHENKMSALYMSIYMILSWIEDRFNIFYPYHVLVLMEKCRQLNLNCTEVSDWTVIKLLDRIIFQLYSNLIPVWTCIIVLDRPHIKEPLIVSTVHMYLGDTIG